MANLATLLNGIKRVANAGVLLVTPAPPAIVLNFPKGGAVYNAITGNIDYTPQGNSQSQQVVNNGGTITASAGSVVWVDASNGTCTVNAPPVAAGAQWGLTDGHQGGSFNASHYASVPNPGANIEDPGAQGTYTNNPILIQMPCASANWTCDPTGTFWRAG
jgi:hypothetical protein